MEASTSLENTHFAVTLPCAVQPFASFHVKAVRNGVPFHEHRFPPLMNTPAPFHFSTWLAGPRIRTVLYALAIVLGIGASIILLQKPGGDTRQAGDLGDTEQEMLFDAQADIDQAIRYYESAISKLTVLAENNVPNLDTTFVALQRERIAELRTSIDECKQALKENKLHPEVQFYLLTAYNDLQGTLQEMIDTTKN